MRVLQISQYRPFLHWSSHPPTACKAASVSLDSENHVCPRTGALLAFNMSSSRHDLKERFIQGRNTWTQGWEDLLHLDPVLFERYVAMRSVPQSRQHLSPKEQEFIWIAVQACTTTQYSPGVQE